MYWYKPAQNSENEIHNKECTKDNHGDEVHELPGAALRVVDLKSNIVEHILEFLCLDNTRIKSKDISTTTNIYNKHFEEFS